MSAISSSVPETSITSDNNIAGTMTAFGDLRVAGLSPVFQGSFEYTVANTEIGTITTTGGGDSVTQANAMAVINTSATTGQRTQWATVRHAKYRPGLGSCVRFTGLWTGNAANTESWLGVFDEAGSSAAFKNGYGIGFDGEDYSVVRFSGDVAETIAQSAYNIDKLDGSGPSGMTIDTTKLNIFQIQYGYLGAGAAIFSIMAKKGDTEKYYPFHIISKTGTLAGPSIMIPNLTFCIMADNKATTADITAKCASYAYFTEGKTEPTELHQLVFGTGKREQSGVTTQVPIFTIRNKSLYASKTNFIDVQILRAGASSESSSANNLSNVEFVKNGNLTGGSWSDINATNSVVEINTAATAISGGTVLPTLELAGKDASGSISLAPYKIILAPGESFSAVGSSSNSATIDSSCFWRELF